ncbi:MAG: hypothetical protein SV775_14065 [Thermodesulfobacteriota bacterium]|nr:hypothetical protein [Thermodesulfobacteriota bacterium]
MDALSEPVPKRIVWVMEELERRIFRMLREGATTRRVCWYFGPSARDATQMLNNMETCELDACFRGDQFCHSCVRGDPGDIVSIH